MAHITVFIPFCFNFFHNAEVFLKSPAKQGFSGFFLAENILEKLPTRKEWAKVSLFSFAFFFAVFLNVCEPVLFPGATVSAQGKGDSSATAQPKSEIRTLKLGDRIERELKGGEAHAYRIDLAAGQYLHAVVEQRGIDVVIRFFGPDEKQLVEIDNPYGARGSESLVFLAERSGTYLLEVRSLDPTAIVGRYELRLEALRAATMQDKQRIAAEKIFAEGQQLEKQGSAESLHAALAKYGDARTQWQALSDTLGEAKAIHQTGYVHLALSEHKKAFEYFQQVLPFWQALQDTFMLAATINNLGAVHQYLGENEEALNSYEQALPMLQQIGDEYGEGYVLNNIAYIYRSLGEPQKALNYNFQALVKRRAAKDSAGEAQSLNNLGVVFEYLGERQKALDYYGQALPLYRAVRDRNGEAFTLNNIGAVYRGLGEHQSALDFYEQALTIEEETGYRYGVAILLNNIGAIYRSWGERRKALDYYERALALRRELADRYGEAITLTNMGAIYRDWSNLQASLDCNSKALALRREVSDRPGEAESLNNLGHLYSLLGDHAKALDHCTQALPLAQAVGDREREAATRRNLAMIEVHLGNLLKARNEIEAALAIIDTLRTKVASPDWRASYFALVQEYYEFYIDLLMRQHQIDPSQAHNGVAFEASEGARARGLIEALGEAHTDIRQGIDSTLVMREYLLQRQINDKEQSRLRLLRQKQNEDKAKAMEKDMRLLLAQYQEIQAKIRDTSPRFAALIQPQPLSVKEIQQQVLDDDTMLLEYALGERHSFLWAVTPTSLNGFELPKRMVIDSLARRVYDLMTARNQRPANETEKARKTRIARADADYPQAAAALSRMVLGPVGAKLGTKRLLIVSDGALQYVPFGALPVPDTTGTVDPHKAHPLVVDHEIISLPSASVLAVLRRETANRASAPKQVAILADPVFAEDDPRLKPADKKSVGTTRSAVDTSRVPTELERATRGMNLSRLLFSRFEAEAIAALTSANERKMALDFAATRATAASPELSQYRIIHFATHGLLNSEHPELSGVVFSLVDENGRQQDGFLRLHDIYNLNLPADLVVLSACQTALGKEVKGEGLVGLVRGFMYAGAPRVVASLWQVNDAATAESMKRFYQGMLEEPILRPPAALRAAQVSMWKEKRWQSPYYWAAFVLQGEWR